MSSKKVLSAVVPCFNESDVLPAFYKEMTRVFKDLENRVTLELIFVDDGSKDNTLQIIKQFASNDQRVKYISFSRNFGKEAAMYAGLKNAKGDYNVLIDADLQHPPALLPVMLDAIEYEGYDSVATCRTDRKGEAKIKSFLSNAFYGFFRKICKLDIKNGAGDFRLMTRQMTDSVLSLCENQRFTKGILSWVGFKTKWVEHENVQREAGQSKWSVLSLAKYSIEGIVGFSTFLLRLPTFLGLALGAVSIVWYIVLLILKICAVKTLGLSAAVATILFVGALILVSIGLSNEYISKVYLEIKDRPVFITKETNIK